MNTNIFMHFNVYQEKVTLTKSIMKNGGDTISKNLHNLNKRSTEFVANKSSCKTASVFSLFTNV